MKVSGFVIEGSNGRMWGPFKTAFDAEDWLNAEGSNLAGNLHIRVLYEPTGETKRSYEAARVG